MANQSLIFRQKYNTMKKVFGLFFSIITLSVSGQNLQTYNGDYEGGVATYQYYENSISERVFQGKFELKSIGNPISIAVSGQYMNDKKDGLWKYTYTNSKGNARTTVVTGKYHSGKMDGYWSMETTETNNRTKTKTIVRKSSINVKNNIIVGSFKYQNADDKDTVNGSFDKNGAFDGTWITVNEGIKKTIEKFRNGVSYKFLFEDEIECLIEMGLVRKKV